MNWNFRPTLAVQHKIDEYNLAPGSNSSKYQRVSPLRASVTLANGSLIRTRAGGEPGTNWSPANQPLS